MLARVRHTRRPSTNISQDKQQVDDAAAYSTAFLIIGAIGAASFHEGNMVEYVVVRCSECAMFQACQQRKDSRFSCPICGTKQSVRKVYGRSSNPRDLRPIVQDFNMQAAHQPTQPIPHDADQDEVDEEATRLATFEDALALENDPWAQICNAGNVDNHPDRPVSRWDPFMSEKEVQGDDDADSAGVGPTLRMTPAPVTMPSQASIVLSAPVRPPRKRPASSSAEVAVKRVVGDRGGHGGDRLSFAVPVPKSPTRPSAPTNQAQNEQDNEEHLIRVSAPVSDFDKEAARKKRWASAMTVPDSSIGDDPPSEMAPVVPSGSKPSSKWSKFL